LALNRLLGRARTARRATGAQGLAVRARFPRRDGGTCDRRAGSRRPGAAAHLPFGASGRNNDGDGLSDNFERRKSARNTEERHATA
jgi:hypothetical protein